MKTQNYAKKLIKVQGDSGEKYARYFSTNLSKYLPKEKTAKILEVGCGIGNLMLAFKSLGYKNIYGLDIDSSNVRLCKKRGLNIIKGDILDNKKQLLMYDLVYAFDVIEHIQKEDLFKFITNCLSKVKPKGALIIKTQNMQNPFAIYSRYIDLTHTLGFTQEVLEQLMDEMGIKTCKILYTDSYIVRDYNPLLFLIKFMIKFMLRFFDFFIQLYLFSFYGGKWINVKREIVLVIKKNESS